jgi:putative hydrolase of the HAD superfamily
MKYNDQYYIFDLGGTLINYSGLAFSWIDYYGEAFAFVRSTLGITISTIEEQNAKNVLIKYNARVNPREIEYSDEVIFREAVSSWNCQISAKEIAISFYRYFQKRLIVYEDTTDVLRFLKKKNYTIGILTDVPTGMPIELVREDISKIGVDIDCIKTSSEIGYRKPNTRGLKEIANVFGVKPDRLAYIGDEPKDIETANQVGAYSVFINRKRKQIVYGECEQIFSLKELI